MYIRGRSAQYWAKSARAELCLGKKEADAVWVKISQDCTRAKAMRGSHARRDGSDPLAVGLRQTAWRSPICTRLLQDATACQPNHRNTGVQGNGQQVRDSTTFPQTLRTAISCWTPTSLRCGRKKPSRAQQAAYICPSRKPVSAQLLGRSVMLA